MSDITIDTLQIHDRLTRLETLIDTLPEINARLTRFEERMDRQFTSLDKRMVTVEKHTSKLEGMIGNLPTMWQLGVFMVTTLIGTAGIAIAAVKLFG